MFKRIRKESLTQLSERSHTPQITIRKQVLHDIMYSLASRNPESGGILLGPIGTTDVTDFYFDKNAKCTSGTYSPDIETLRHHLKTVCQPRNIDFKGFAHSHPKEYDKPSQGDIRYIKRLLAINPEDSMFFAPIIIAHQFRMVPYVIQRERQDTPVIANLNIV